MNEIERIERAHRTSGAPLLQQLQKRMRAGDEHKFTKIPPNVQALLTNPKRRLWLLLHDMLYIYALEQVEPLFAPQQERLIKLWSDYDIIIKPVHDACELALKPAPAALASSRLKLDRVMLASARRKLDKLEKLMDTLERVERGLRHGTDLMALALMFRLLPITRKAGADDRFWRRAAKKAETGRNLAFDADDIDLAGVDLNADKESAWRAVVLKAAMVLEGAAAASLKSAVNKHRKSQAKLR